MKIINLYETNLLSLEEDIINLWQLTIAESFPLSMDLFRRNTIYCQFLDLKRSSVVLIDGKLAGVCIVKSGPFSLLHTAAQPVRIWISLILVHPEYQRKGIGKALLSKISENKEGVEEIHTGSDPQHFFPGVPSRLSQAKRFFSSRGFHPTGTAYDLIGNLSDFNEVYNEKPGYVVRRLQASEQGALFSLLKQEFSLRWQYETMESLTREKEADAVIGLFHEGKLMGFAHVHRPGDRFWIPSVYWKKEQLPLIGGLGPIGISEAYRGKGLGQWFFSQSLNILKREGVKKIRID